MYDHLEQIRRDLTNTIHTSSLKQHNFISLTKLCFDIEFHGDDIVISGMGINDGVDCCGPLPSIIMVIIINECKDEFTKWFQSCGVNVFMDQYVRDEAADPEHYGDEGRPCDDIPYISFKYSLRA